MTNNSLFNRNKILYKIYNDSCLLRKLPVQRPLSSEKQQESNAILVFSSPNQQSRNVGKFSPFLVKSANQRPQSFDSLWWLVKYSVSISISVRAFFLWLYYVYYWTNNNNIPQNVKHFLKKFLKIKCRAATVTREGVMIFPSGK